MDPNRHPVQNGGVNNTNNSQSLNGRFRSRVRPFTVEEALPYSPFSSIVPFNPDIIPTPTIGLRSSASLFATEDERDAGRQGLESLNREAENPTSTSQRLQQTLSSLQNLLLPENLTQYKFKTRPQIPSGSGPQTLPKMALSPFAQKLYDSTSVEFRYPTPETPSPPIRQVSQVQKQSAPAKSKPKPTPSPASNNHTHSSIKVEIPSQKSTNHLGTPPAPLPRPKITPVPVPVSKIEVVIPSIPETFKRNEYSSQPEVLSPVLNQTRPPPYGKSTTKIPSPELQRKPVIPSPASQATPKLQSNTGLAVVIPNPPSNFNPRDYEVVPDSPGSPGHLSKKRKYSEFDESLDAVAGGSDQREKADTAFRNLHEYLRDLFEAQDQLESNPSAPNTYFTQVGDELGLTAPAQGKVEILLRKTIDVGRFSQVSLDDLLRIQKLCEGTLRATENLEIKVEEEMGESDIEAWLIQISNAELGIKAARTSLRLMSGGREDRQLYSEDVIQASLNVFKNTVENCIIPIVELRNSSSSASLFKLLSTEKSTINHLLMHCRQLFSLMAVLITAIDLSDTVLNTLEFTASRLIFVENAHFERDSVLGTAKFDNFRVVAMDVLAHIFLSSPSQRQGIFDEILTSLEKLPVTKQSARQFKLADGGSIQLVSALIMRLIQTSAIKSDEGKATRRTKALEVLGGDVDGNTYGNDDAQPNKTKFVIDSEHRAEQQAVTAIFELGAVAPSLMDTARTSASYVVAFIVGRAMKSTKSGDTPYRNLLDLFVEDFITCLSSPEWPAAEILLRLLVFKMVTLAEGDKTPAPAKNMALDLLGLMAAAISELNSHIQKSASAFGPSNGQQSEMMGEYLSRLAKDSLDKRRCADDVVSWTGPFRASLEYLHERSKTDPQIASSITYLTAEWGCKVHTTFDEPVDDDEDVNQREQEFGRLAFRLRMMLSDEAWLSREYVFSDTVSASHVRLAYGVVLLHSQFCESFNRVLQILLSSMASDQATVRSKSLRSVNQLLETDPTILDRNETVKLLILKCSNDPSVLVRDSALGLIGKCITLRPVLEDGMMVNILHRVSDSGVGVRKRAMKLCKDIYLRNSKPEIKSAIADALLHRVADIDESVQELARQTIEEVWLSPFYHLTASNEGSPQIKLALAEQVALMTKTLQRGSDMATVLDKVLQNMLSADSKFASANFKVCTALVATMFETIIDNSADSGSDTPSARDALQVLTIFAKSNPKLFTPEQIKLLQPYVNNVGAKDDLAIYRFVVVIFRHVLPQLSKVHNSFLVSIRLQLLPSITKMNRLILDDLVACLWIISVTLDDFQHLTNLAMQTLTKIASKTNADLHNPSKPEDIPSLIKLLTITGMFGKHCDLDPQIAIFRQKMPKLKGNSVSRLMADTFAPFATSSQPIEVRKAAMDAIGMVCQTWPKNFDSPNIWSNFLDAFHEQNVILEAIILRAFKEFLAIEEKRSEIGTEVVAGAAAESVAKLGVMGGSQGDGIALSIAQRFLTHITRIALSSQDEQALLATEVLASINRQGLVHPKETAVALIALETSQNSKISDLAFQEHRAAHEKHETILEKEYMRGVYSAYVYHRDVINNTHGAITNPFASKLHRMIEVMKISKPKNRKRFYDSLCNRIDFDPAKMAREEIPEHLQFAQFIIENMAFFEYSSVDELTLAVTSMEKVVATTGTGIAHSIETEIFHMKMDQPSQIDENGQSQLVEPTVDPSRLSELAAYSMVLSSLWETRSYLRKQYGLSANRKDPKGKAIVKDLNKAPVKVPFVTGEKLWEQIATIMAASESEELMLKQCRSFIELLSVDQDFKLAAEADEEAEGGRLGTPSDDEDENEGPVAPGSGRGRKRKSTGASGGKKKQARSGSKTRGRPRKKSFSSHGSDGEDGWN